MYHTPFMGSLVYTNLPFYCFFFVCVVRDCVTGCMCLISFAALLSFRLDVIKLYHSLVVLLSTCIIKRFCKAYNNTPRDSSVV